MDKRDKRELRDKRDKRVCGWGGCPVGEDFQLVLGRMWDWG